MTEFRCGVMSSTPMPDGRGRGCCRELHHSGLHCSHPGDELTGDPGVIVANPGSIGGHMFRPRFKRCDGTANPTSDRLLPARKGALEAGRFVLDTGDTP
jgi:hypothetical protein